MASHFAPQHAKGKTSRRASGAQRPSSHSRSDASYYAAARKSRRRGGGNGGSHRGRTVGIAVAVVLAAVLVAVGTAGVMLYRSAMSVRDRASTIMAQASTLTDALQSGDNEGLSSSVGVIVENTNAINNEVNSTLWDLATYIPVVGEDIRSVQTLGTAAHSLVNGALVPITNNISGMSLSDLLQDGAVNIEMVRTLSSSVSDALPVIQGSIDTITALPEAHIPQLRDILSRVQEPLQQVKGALDQVEPVLDVLPQMLGADGQARTYLVIAQNNSELRSTGGLPGSWATLTVSDGVISMGSDFETILHRPGFNVSATQEEIWHICSTIHTDPAQVNFTPDFSRVGELSREYWQQAGYGDVDGVIAVDPVFLQRLLSLTDGFTAPDGVTVDGTNAAEVLLSDTYWKFGNDGDTQDAYFASVASLAFEHIMNNLGNTGFTDLLDVISKSAEDGRLLVWMYNEEEQAAMSSMGLTGALSTDESTSVLGVYLNDDTVSKISWYASVGTEIGEGVKNADATVTYDVTTTLTNTITQEEAASAPRYISGENANKRDVSDMLTYVSFFAPAGGTISDFSVSEGGLIEEPDHRTVYGFDRVSAHVHARAGETVTFSYKVTVSADATEPLALRTTPLAQESLIQ